MKLYTELAEVYHLLYPQVFDYNAEFEFYNGVFHDYRCRKILELGCGTGHLAKKFIEDLYNYLGLDLNEPMLKIARQFVPQAHFTQGDMRSFRSQEIFDAVLSTGKTFSHLITNNDVLSCFESVHRVLRPKGIFAFDNFNASHIFTNFRQTTESENKVGQVTYTRISTHTMQLTSGFTWNWDCIYYIKTGENTSQRIVQDDMVVRAFTKDELELLLRMSHFEPLGYHIPESDPSKLIFIAVKN